MRTHTVTYIQTYRHTYTYIHIQLFYMTIRVFTRRSLLFNTLTCFVSFAALSCKTLPNDLLCPSGKDKDIGTQMFQMFFISCYLNNHEK